MTEAEISNLQDKENYIQNEYNRDTYIEVGRFSANGLAANKVPDSIGAIAELRIRVIDHKNENWVALSEVSREFIIFSTESFHCSDCFCFSDCCVAQTVVVAHVVSDFAFQLNLRIPKTYFGRKIYSMCA